MKQVENGRKTMKLKIEITMDGADRNLEAADILRELADDMDEGRKLSDTSDHCALRDMDGNPIGEAKMTPSAEFNISAMRLDHAIATDKERRGEK